MNQRRAAMSTQAFVSRGARSGGHSTTTERLTDRLDPVDPSLLVEQYTVAMTLVTFLVILAAALMYQGAASSGGFNAFFVAALGPLGAAGVIAALARRHFFGRHVMLGRRNGLSDEEATVLARRDLERIATYLDRGLR